MHKLLFEVAALEHKHRCFINTKYDEGVVTIHGRSGNIRRAKRELKPLFPGFKFKDIPAIKF